MTIFPTKKYYLKLIDNQATTLHQLENNTKKYPIPIKFDDSGSKSYGFVVKESFGSGPGASKG